VQLFRFDYGFAGGERGEARKSLHSGAKEQVYTAIEARLPPGETETAIAHFTAPAALSGANREELVERARRALAAVAKVRHNRVRERDGGIPSSRNWPGW